jgi:serine/threonine-protein kinase
MVDGDADESSSWGRRFRGDRVQLAQAGQALGAGYRFDRPVGSGAIGEVWAVRGADGSVYAAKLLRPEHASDPDIVERFVRERSVLLGLRHPHIVAVRDLVVEGPRLAIVMDFVPGGSLRDAVSATGPLRPSASLEVMAEVFDALAAAHTAGVVHRDIKPDNVLLQRPWGHGGPGDIRVSDFGVSSVLGERARHTTGLVGTPQYMSPELISQGLSGAAGDVYSAGIMLYELLSGRTPFAGPGTDFTIAYRHVSSRVPPLDVPEDLRTVLDSLLSKSPEQRPTAFAAAALMRQLAPRLADVPALPASATPDTFQETDRPATVVRGAFTGAEWEALAGPAEMPEGPVPELGQAGSATIARPMPRREPVARPRLDSESPEGVRPFWRTRKALLLACSAVALIAAGVGGFMLMGPKGGEQPQPASGTALSAHLTGQALPTGLSVSREARFDPGTGRTTLTLSYSAQKAALSGDVLEVVPGLGMADACPAVNWKEGVVVARNQPSVTGVEAACGWRLSVENIPAGGTLQVSAEVELAPVDQQALDGWLRAGQEVASKTLQNPEVRGTAYVIQRLQGIEVRTPSRVVSNQPVVVKLLPVWPGGVDQDNPLYVSPSTGKPSQMLTAVAEGEKGVRFADGCSGALAVDGSGLSVTALQISPQCTVRATVGNFTDLQSSPFSITSREAS